jgi:hypothetical protein
MSFVLSNGWFAWISALLGLALGAATFGQLGLAHGDVPARLGPLPAALATVVVVTAVFYVAFGVLSMRWFGKRYWLLMALWNGIWLAASYALDFQPVKPIGIAYAILTGLVVWRLVPDGELNTRLRTGRRS